MILWNSRFLLTWASVGFKEKTWHLKIKISPILLCSLIKIIKFVPSAVIKFQYFDHKLTPFLTLYHPYEQWTCGNRFLWVEIRVCTSVSVLSNFPGQKNQELQSNSYYIRWPIYLHSSEDRFICRSYSRVVCLKMIKFLQLEFLNKSSLSQIKLYKAPMIVLFLKIFNRNILPKKPWGTEEIFFLHRDHASSWLTAVFANNFFFAHFRVYVA